jgi:3-hydroxyisobutyrate dehydrogenase-like beta-hydroxyacid dehydrogenase
VTHPETRRHTLGWIGTGRMGLPMATRLIEAGCDVAVFNRTRAKAEPLAALGARLVDAPAELADRDVVFTMVAGPEEYRQVTLGPQGLLSRPGAAPRVLVDCSTVSEEAALAVRAVAERVGTQVLAAPVSGNGKVVRAGLLSIVASGPPAAFETARPYLEALGRGVSYVGEGELARVVKLCHNVLLGIVIQGLTEVTVLAEKSGVPRHAFLDFINRSVLGSLFTRYKTPALVHLDYTPAFTTRLLRKDLELGLQIGRAREVPLPLAALVRETLQSLIGHGYGEADFAALLTLHAQAAGLELKPEPVEVGDGLEALEPDAARA